jgi:diadenosine tetraphosphate (Ap4A) HIT family hydrolase
MSTPNTQQASKFGQVVTDLAREFEEKVMFEDDHTIVFFNLDPITLGQFKIFPKEAYAKFEDIPSELSVHLFTIANKCSAILFEALKAHGSNLIIRDGKDADNSYDRICIEAIARFENDDIDMLWQPKQGDMSKIAQTASQIKDAFIFNPKGIPILNNNSNQSNNGNQNVHQNQANKSNNVNNSRDTQNNANQNLDVEKKDSYWESQLRRIP